MGQNVKNWYRKFIVLDFSVHSSRDPVYEEFENIETSMVIVAVFRLLILIY